MKIAEKIFGHTFRVTTDWQEQQIAKYKWFQMKGNEVELFFFDYQMNQVCSDIT